MSSRLCFSVTTSLYYSTQPCVFSTALRPHDAMRLKQYQKNGKLTDDLTPEGSVPHRFHCAMYLGRVVSISLRSDGSRFFARREARATIFCHNINLFCLISGNRTIYFNSTLVSRCSGALQCDCLRLVTSSVTFSHEARKRCRYCLCFKRRV